MNESDNRRHPRYAVDVEASVRLPDGKRVRARTRDVSRAGICLITGEVVPSGSTVNIDMVLAFDNNAFSEPLSLEARIVWCTRLADAFQVGAMFDELTDQQDGFLEMFLHFLDGTISPKGVSDDLGVEPDTEVLDVEDKDDPFRR
jgi:hypothetical protein